MLFEHLELSYIAALDQSKNPKAANFKQKYHSRIFELKNLFNNRTLYQVQTYLNIIIAILYFRLKLSGRVSLVVYGAGTRWLIMYPLFRLLRYKIVFSERNDGFHKAKILYRIMEKCDVLTTNSIEAKNVIARYVKNKEIHVVNNGICVPAHGKAGCSFHSPLRIVVPARIARIKNQKIVIEALSKVSDVEVHFAGKMDDAAYYNELYNLIRINGLEKKFIFDGYVEDMGKYYHNIDLVILPSLSEGTPNVILESMALQKPCIASNISMNSRLINDDKFLFDPNYSLSLYKCILYFMSLSSSEIEKHLTKNYLFVQTNYSVEKMVSSFKELIYTN